jgi:uncharacterized protein YybS (DUF2232 family)
MAQMPFQSPISKDIATGVMATLVIFSLSVFMPVVGFFFTIFTPLPILFYRTKLGRRHGAVVPLIVLFIMAIVLGGVTADMFFFSGLMLLGFAMSEMFEKKLPVEVTVLATCGTVLGAGLIGILLYSIANGVGVFTLVSNYVATNLALSLELYKGIGIPQETIDTISASLDQIQYILIRILPSLTVASTLFVAWTNLIAARPIMRRRGLVYPDFGQLNHWKAPDLLIWGVIGCGLTLLVPSTGIRLIGLNGLLVLLTIYFLQGIAIVSFFFEKKNVPRGIRVFVYVMIGFQQLFLLVVICIGLFDMWINFRKINTNTHETDLPS